MTSDSGHALWGPSDPDLSRGNGDYTPRDKTICVMNPKVVRNDAHSDVLCCVHRQYGQLPVAQKWTASQLDFFSVFFCAICSSNPCLHGSCSWQPHPDPVTFLTCSLIQVTVHSLCQEAECTGNEDRPRSNLLCLGRVVFRLETRCNGCRGMRRLTHSPNRGDPDAAFTPC